MFHDQRAEHGGGEGKDGTRLEGARRAALDRRLIVIPVPARDESHTEYQLALEWRTRFARELAEFCSDWIPGGEKAESVLDYLKIPYVAYWSVGERLPVLEEEPTIPRSMPTPTASSPA